MTQRWYGNDTDDPVGAFSATGVEKSSQATAPGAVTHTGAIAGGPTTLTTHVYSSPSGEPGASSWENPSGGNFKASINVTAIGADIALTGAGGGGVTPLQAMASDGSSISGLSGATWTWSSTTGTGVKTGSYSAGTWGTPTPGSTDRLALNIVATNSNMMTSENLSIDIGSSTWFEGPFTVTAVYVPRNPAINHQNPGVL